MSWTAAHGAQLPGEKYRCTLKIRAPYTIENIENLEHRWREAAGINGSFTVETFAVAFPVAGVWTATITYHINSTAHASSGGFVVDGIGRIAADIVGFIIGASALVLATVEKFVVEVVQGVTKPVLDAAHEILNPGVLILAVVGIFLVLQIRRG